MKDKTETAAAAVTHPLAPILGAIEITVTKRNGAQEKVKVRQLPIRLLGEWSRVIEEESALVELYCDQIDRDRDSKLRKLGAEVVALYQQIQKGLSGEELEKVSNDLAMTRAEIDKITGAPRWDDELTPESHDEIVRIGYELNRPRFDRWLQNRQNAIGHLKDVYKQYLPEHPLLQSREQGAGSAEKKAEASPGSAASSPTSPPSPAEVTPK